MSYGRGVGALGSDAHRVLIERIVDHYHGDVRVRAVAVFGSVSTGGWHDLSDVDVDVVIDDGVVIARPSRRPRYLAPGPSSSWLGPTRWTWC